MENYFQAEAFNLDKVLDEFEQNEGELRRNTADGRGLSEEPWSGRPLVEAKCAPSSQGVRQ